VGLSSEVRAAVRRRGVQDGTIRTTGLAGPDEAEEIARLGWAHVRAQFLTPRLLRDELRLIRSLVEGQVHDVSDP